MQFMKIIQSDKYENALSNIISSISSPSISTITSSMSSFVSRNEVEEITNELGEKILTSDALMKIRKDVANEVLMTLGSYIQKLENRIEELERKLED